MKRATEVLVKAAQQAKQRDEDEEINVSVDTRKVGGIKQVRHTPYMHTPVYRIIVLVDILVICMTWFKTIISV